MPPSTSAFDLPLFPLQSVLFPGGLLSLKVFEARYLDLMGLDKKVRDGKLRFVLQQGIGKSVLTSDYDAAALQQTLALDDA